MANIATKILIFSLILSFSINLVTPVTKTGSIGAGSVTYNELQGNLTSTIPTQGQLTAGSTLVDSISGLITGNIATVAVTVLGVLTGNMLLVFAGIGLTLLNYVLIPSAIINESLGGNFGSFFSNFISILYAISIISWYGQRENP
jgi:hypothetical protein